VPIWLGGFAQCKPHAFLAWVANTCNDDDDGGAGGPRPGNACDAGFADVFVGDRIPDGMGGYTDDYTTVADVIDVTSTAVKTLGCELVDIAGTYYVRAYVNNVLKASHPIG
jgi:hypothetical protein